MRLYLIECAFRVPRRLECRTGRATFCVGCPPDTIGGITIIGPWDSSNGDEEAA